MQQAAAGQATATVNRLMNTALSTGGYKRENTWTASFRKAKNAKPGTEGKVKYLRATKGGFKTKTTAPQHLDRFIVDFTGKSQASPKSKSIIIQRTIG